MSFESPNFTQVPNLYLEELIAGNLKEIDSRIMALFIRNTFGWQERSAALCLSRNDIADILGYVKLKPISESLERLENEKDWIQSIKVKDLEPRVRENIETILKVSKKLQPNQKIYRLKIEGYENRSWDNIRQVKTSKKAENEGGYDTVPTTENEGGYEAVSTSGYEAVPTSGYEAVPTSGDHTVPTLELETVEGVSVSEPLNKGLNKDLNKDLNKISNLLSQIDFNELVLPLPIKRFLYKNRDKGEELSINYDELETFYNTSPYIKADAEKDDYNYLNVFEFKNMLETIYYKLTDRIENTNGLLHKWTVDRLHYKRENVFAERRESTSDDSEQNRTLSRLNTGTNSVPFFDWLNQ
ncbi:hypothetical protein ACTHPB_27820 [Priestia megaterium]|uniref:hypothetical protein n=1 Tax=Priestia megaterium TaxID=1404 RepID=UPI003F818B74